MVLAKKLATAAVAAAMVLTGAAGAMAAETSDEKVIVDEVSNTEQSDLGDESVAPESSEEEPSEEPPAPADVEDATDDSAAVTDESQVAVVPASDLPTYVQRTITAADVPGDAKSVVFRVQHDAAGIESREDHVTEPDAARTTFVPVAAGSYTVEAWYLDAEGTQVSLGEEEFEVGARAELPMTQHLTVSGENSPAGVAREITASAVPTDGRMVQFVVFRGEAWANSQVATVTSAQTATTSFTPDVAGEYTVDAWSIAADGTPTVIGRTTFTAPQAERTPVLRVTPADARVGVERIFTAANVQTDAILVRFEVIRGRNILAQLEATPVDGQAQARFTPDAAGSYELLVWGFTQGMNPVELGTIPFTVSAQASPSPSPTPSSPSPTPTRTPTPTKTPTRTPTPSATAKPSWTPKPPSSPVPSNRPSTDHRPTVRPSNPGRPGHFGNHPGTGLNLALPIALSGAALTAAGTALGVHRKRR